MHKKTRMVMLIFIAVTGFIAGAVSQGFPILSLSKAQEQADTSQGNKIFVRGTGFATTSKRPPGEKFIFYTGSTSFRAVPPGKTFIITDLLYTTRYVKQNLTVNLAEAFITKESNASFKADNFLQMDFQPGESKETHLCTGYTIRSGHGVSAWTNAGLDPDQTVQIVVSGYLTDEVK